MRRLLTLAAVLVLLVMMLPVLACATPSTVTRANQDCCRQAHAPCGQMPLDGCCQVQVRMHHEGLPTPLVAAPAFALSALALLPRLAALPSAAGHARHLADQHSPPGLRTAAPLVLRI